MLCWTFTFLVIAILGIVVGTTETKAESLVMAKLLVVVFFSLFAAMVATGLFRRPPADTSRR